MGPWITALAILVVLAAVLWAGWFAIRQERTENLRDRFGAEYDRLVAEEGSRRDAEAELSERVERREELEIRPLPLGTSLRYMSEWREIQAGFVDQPGQALVRADRLLTDVMRERGYPIDDFEQRAADLSVEHADVVDDYRAAHAISVRNERGRASTEELRRAMIHYRLLFDRLVETEEETSGRRT